MKIETAFDRKYSKMNECKPEDIPDSLANKTIGVSNQNKMVDDKLDHSGINGFGKIIDRIKLGKFVIIIAKKN